MSDSKNSVQIIVPPLGESVTEATVAKWHKKIGEAVTVDELLVELETEKVALEVSAPNSGVLSEIAIDVGGTVNIGALLGSIDTSVQAIAATKAIPQVSSDAKTKQDTVIASPAANKIAADNDIDLSSIDGSGRSGRITKGDVIQSQNSPTISVHTVKSAQEDFLVRSAQGGRTETKVVMTRLRKTIAKRLKDSQNTAAILSTFNEIDMFEVIRLRQTYQEKFKEKHSIKLGFMSFFVKAVVIALQESPNMNAEIRGDDIIYKDYYDIGVAVGTEQGLVVPIVLDADKLSFAELETRISELGKKARDGKLSMSDMTGGTFSITNGGIYGSLLSTPIINPPQSGILGMHNIVERPIAMAGQVVIRPMTYVALSYDHRIVDGKEAVTFLVRIKELVEHPERLLLNI